MKLWKDAALPPRTLNEIMDERAESIQRFRNSRPRFDGPINFTCDDCRIKEALQYCPFIFDHYNTNGDCLLEK